MHRPNSSQSNKSLKDNRWLRQLGKTRNHSGQTRKSFLVPSPSLSKLPHLLTCVLQTSQRISSRFTESTWQIRFSKTATFWITGLTKQKWVIWKKRIPVCYARKPIWFKSYSYEYGINERRRSFARGHLSEEDWAAVGWIYWERNRCIGQSRWTTEFLEGISRVWGEGNTDM